MDKIALIGPVAEKYKGGVAYFTTCLANELANRCELKLISWSRLYPPFLSKRQFLDDSSKLLPTEQPVDFALNYLNPFSWFRTAVMLRQYQAVVFNWVHPVHAPVYIFMMLILRTFSKAKVLIICHNILPHESFPLAKVLSKMVLRLSHLLVVHGGEQYKEAKSMGCRAEKLFLPIFPFNLNSSEVQAKREQVNLQLLFFGVIRPYKGLDLLLEAIQGIEKVSLTVAGEAFSEEENDKLRSLVASLGLEEQVTLDLRYIPNEEVGTIFEKADLLVLPYRSATSSAALTVAYDFAKPVLATNVGSLPDAVEVGVSGYIVEPSSDAIAEGIKRFIDCPISEAGIKDYAKKLSFGSYADALLKSC